MKSVKFEWNGEFYEIRGYRGVAIGHVEKVLVGRNKQWCLVSDDLSWWRPDCLRQVADFINLLDTKELGTTPNIQKPCALQIAERLEGMAGAAAAELRMNDSLKLSELARQLRLL